MDEINFSLTNPHHYLDDMLLRTRLLGPAKIELKDRYLCGRTYHGLFHPAFLWHCHLHFWHSLNSTLDIGWPKVPKDLLRFHRRMANTIACHDVIMATDGTSELQSANWYDSRQTEWKMVCRRPPEIQTDHYKERMEAYERENQEIDEDALWVKYAILASQDHLADRPMDTEDDQLLQYFLGIDLLPLAAPAPIYRYNTLMLRAEYSHRSDAEWKEGRNAFLQKIQTYPAIYRHPAFHRFEQAARDNIDRALNE